MGSLTNATPRRISSVSQPFERLSHQEKQKNFQYIHCYLIEGEIIRPEYVSFIGAAQKRAESQNITQLFRMLEPMAAVDPSVMQIFNPQGIARYGSEIFDVPTEVTRSEEEITEILEAQKQQADQAAQAQNAQAIAGAAKDGADALATAQGVSL